MEKTNDFIFHERNLEKLSARTGKIYSCSPHRIYFSGRTREEAREKLMYYVRAEFGGCGVIQYKEDKIKKGSNITYKVHGLPVEEKAVSTCYAEASSIEEKPVVFSQFLEFLKSS